MSTDAVHSLISQTRKLRPREDLLTCLVSGMVPTSSQCPFQDALPNEGGQGGPNKRL